MQPQLTKDQLKKIVPAISDKNLETYLPLLIEAFEKFSINTLERICCFIAQVAHESGSFHYNKELASGEAYDTGKKAIALGNTPEKDGDGQKFKGRGLIQITGKTNYKACSMFLFNDERLLDHPELLEEPQHALDSACFFWTKNNLNSICDKPEAWRNEWRGKRYNRFEYLTLRINGGQNGLSDRLAFYKRAKEVLVNNNNNGNSPTVPI